MNKQTIAVSLVLLAIMSVGIAGVVVAQTQNATTDHATTSSTTSTTGATADTSSCCCTSRGGPTFGGSILSGKHGGAHDCVQGCATASSRQQLKSWYQQLPQDQKTALQNDLGQAYKSWYQQLPQDQKDKLATILNQLPQDERTNIKDKFGIQ